MESEVNFGSVLREVFATYREKAHVLIPVAIVFYGILTFIEVIAAENTAVLAISVVLGVLVGFLYQGVVVNLILAREEGRPEPSLKELVRSTTPVLVNLIGAGLLAGLGIAFGLLLLIVPGAYLATIWILTAPVIVVERREITQAFDRSRDLVRGNGWRVFAVLIFSVVLTAIVAIGTDPVALGIVEDYDVIAFFERTIGAAIVAPVEALVATVLYFRLRPPTEPDPAPASTL